MKMIYKVVPIETDGTVLDTEKFFNEFGNTGWELVYVRERKGKEYEGAEDLCVFMKRVKDEEKKSYEEKKS
jgi:hypothetical protein